MITGSVTPRREPLLGGNKLEGDHGSFYEKLSPFQGGTDVPTCCVESYRRGSSS